MTAPLADFADLIDAANRGALPREDVALSPWATSVDPNRTVRFLAGRLAKESSEAPGSRWDFTGDYLAQLETLRLWWDGLALRASEPVSVNLSLVMGRLKV